MESYIKITVLQLLKNSSLKTFFMWTQINQKPGPNPPNT